MEYSIVFSYIWKIQTVNNVRQTEADAVISKLICSDFITSSRSHYVVIALNMAKHSQVYIFYLQKAWPKLTSTKKHKANKQPSQVAARNVARNVVDKLVKILGRYEQNDKKVSNFEE